MVNFLTVLSACDIRMLLYHYFIYTSVQNGRLYYTGCKQILLVLLMLYNFVLNTFFQNNCLAMKSRSDRIVYGEIPIEIDTAIYP